MAASLTFARASEARLRRRARMRRFFDCARDTHQRRVMKDFRAIFGLQCG